MTESSFPERPRKYGLAGQVVATLTGALIWGAFFALFGLASDQVLS